MESLFKCIVFLLAVYVGKEIDIYMKEHQPWVLILFAQGGKVPMFYYVAVPRTTVYIICIFQNNVIPYESVVEVVIL